MITPSHTARASLIVLATGTLWGLYWLPVRRLDTLGLPGAWGTFAICAMAVLLLSPFAWRARAALRRADRIGLAAVALGGVAFMLYSVALLYGRVGIVVILFFLTPVWSTLIGRIVMGWPVHGMRIAALMIGLLGLLLTLGARGDIPMPRGLGEWLGLISGILWSIATTGIRTRSDTGAGATGFVFAAGAAISALIFAVILAPIPPLPLTLPFEALAWIAATAALWWGASMAALMWATARLEPARVGILLMSEVLVGAASAALIAGEALGALEMVGGALVILAGVLEVAPQRRPA
jgi:drug/metabolite transporter (DMT)-like permease